MLAVLGIASIAGGTCLACSATDTRFETETDLLSGLLLVSGLSMIGAVLSVFH
jgi:hypothetical protein